MAELEQAERVQIEFVEQPIRVTVDLSRLTWGDLLELQRAKAQAEQDAAAGGASDTAERLLTELVTKVCGEDARQMPAMAVSRVVEAMLERASATGATAKN